MWPSHCRWNTGSHFKNSDQSNSNKNRKARGLRVEVTEGLESKQIAFDSTLLGREVKGEAP